MIATKMIGCTKVSNIDTGIQELMVSFDCYIILLNKIINNSIENISKLNKDNTH